MVSSLNRFDQSQDPGPYDLESSRRNHNDCRSMSRKRVVGPLYFSDNHACPTKRSRTSTRGNVPVNFIFRDSVPQPPYPFQPAEVGPSHPLHEWNGVEGVGDVVHVSASLPYSGAGVGAKWDELAGHAPMPDECGGYGWPSGLAIERTASGLSIIPQNEDTMGADETDGRDGHLREWNDRMLDERDGTVSDAVAAQVVYVHMTAPVEGRSADCQRAERILRRLLRRQRPYSCYSVESELDMQLANLSEPNAIIRHLFWAANCLFFAGKLTGRVSWDWSGPSSARFGPTGRVIATTALRRACAPAGGFETLVVLSTLALGSSRPQLPERWCEDPSATRFFARRFLVAAFLHELIHCYLFVQCGFKARRHGGHTEGFHAIAALVDDWAGPDTVRMCEVEADIAKYRDEAEADAYLARMAVSGAREGGHQAGRDGGYDGEVLRRDRPVVGSKEHVAPDDRPRGARDRHHDPGHVVVADARDKGRSGQPQLVGGPFLVYPRRGYQPSGHRPGGKRRTAGLAPR